MRANAASCKALDGKNRKKYRMGLQGSQAATKKDLLTLHEQQFYRVWMTFFLIKQRDQRMALKATGNSYFSPKLCFL